MQIQDKKNVVCEPSFLYIVMLYEDIRNRLTERKNSGDERITNINQNSNHFFAIFVSELLFKDVSRI